MHSNASDYIYHVSGADKYQALVSGVGLVDKYKQSSIRQQKQKITLQTYISRLPTSGSGCPCQVPQDVSTSLVIFLFYETEGNRKAAGKAWWLELPDVQWLGEWRKIITANSLSKRKPRAATYLCCQVMPCSQVLKAEEAVPVPSSTPAWVVLDYLQEER